MGTAFGGRVAENSRMEILDTGRAVSFEHLKPGTLFRGFIDDVPLIAVRASGHFGTASDDEIAVLLSPGIRDISQAHVFHRSKLDQGTVLELVGAAFLPSLENSAYKNSYAEIGDVELSHGSISLVVKLPTRGWSPQPHCFDLRSGEIKTRSSAVESIVSSQWSVIHTVNREKATIAQYKAPIRLAAEAL
jgi:hypothetical protein